MLTTLWTSGLSARASDVIYLDQNKPAPYSGYLFSIDKEREVRLELIEKDFTTKRLDLTTKVNQENERQLDIMTQRLNNFKVQNDQLSKELIESRNSNFWQYSLFFLTGAILTGTISYGLFRATK